MFKPSAYSLTSEDWKGFLSREGYSVHILSSWLNKLYNKSSSSDQQISNRLIELCLERFDLSLPEISKVQESTDGTYKFLMRFKDGLEVETVLIPFFKRYTICLSTQVGCAMRCSFCYTGTQGLRRHLSSFEMIGQYQMAFQWLKNNKLNSVLPNIVFMGQGEPLHNHTEVLHAIKIFNDPNLLGLGRRQMTLSTVGYLPGMKNFKNFPAINLALSLHSPFDDERSKLIPINDHYPLQEIMQELDNISLINKQFITYEYLVIKNFNSTDKHVDALIKLLAHRKAIINLIPFNPFPGSLWDRPSEEEVQQFKQKLVRNKLRVMVRTTKGSDILAACGQLKVASTERPYGI